MAFKTKYEKHHKEVLELAIGFMFIAALGLLYLFLAG